MSGTLYSTNESVSSNANEGIMTLSSPTLLNAVSDSDIAEDFDFVANAAVDKCQITKPVTYKGGIYEERSEGGIYEERSYQNDQMASTSTDEEVFSSSATRHSHELLSPSSLRSPEMSTSSSFFTSAPSVSNFGLQSPAATTGLFMLMSDV